MVSRILFSLTALAVPLVLVVSSPAGEARAQYDVGDSGIGGYMGGSVDITIESNDSWDVDEDEPVVRKPKKHSQKAERQAVASNAKAPAAVEPARDKTPAMTGERGVEDVPAPREEPKVEMVKQTRPDVVPGLADASPQATAEARPALVASAEAPSPTNLPPAIAPAAAPSSLQNPIQISTMSGQPAGTRPAVIHRAAEPMGLASIFADDNSFLASKPQERIPAQLAKTDQAATPKGHSGSDASAGSLSDTFPVTSEGEPKASSKGDVVQAVEIKELSSDSVKRL